MNNAHELHNEIKKARLESKKALSKLIENYSRLDEGKRTRNMGRSIIKEAILFERLTLLEAAGQDVHHMAEMMDGMKMSAELLAKRLGLEGLASRMDAIRVPDVFELDSMFLSKPHLKKFMKDFADVAAVTKGLLALSDDLGETQGGLGGPLGEVFKTLQMAGGISAEGNLGQALFAYDNATTPMNKKKFGFGRKSKAVSMEKKFAESINNILRTKSPSAVKIINPQELIASLMKQPIKQIIRAFHAYSASVTHYVDDDMLMALSKGPGGVTGILKDLVDMFQGSAPAPSRG